MEGERGDERNSFAAAGQTTPSGILRGALTQVFSPPSSIVDTVAVAETGGGSDRSRPLLEIGGGGGGGEGEVVRTVATQPRKTAILLTAFLACLSVIVFASTLFTRFFSELSRNELVWKHFEMWLKTEQNKE